jgi:signal transduction histidine kinase
VAKLKTSQWYGLALACSLAFVLMNTYIATRSIFTLLDAQHWQAHTLEIISHTETLVAKVRSAESAARGYILTGSPSFRQQYMDSSSSIDGEVSAIQQLTADNASQQQRILVLRTAISAKMGALQAGVDVRQGQPTGMIDPSLLQPVLDDTPDRAASVTYVVSQIEAEENRLLNQRTHDTVVARRQVWASFIGASLLDILLLLAAFALLLRTERTRVQLAEGAAALAANTEEIALLNRDLTALNTDLESRVADRTRELAVSNQELEAFSYSVSHDLRAPLRTIDGFSLALQEDFADKLDASGRDYITRVRNGVQRMGSLIDALLQLSRVTRSELQTEPLDLARLAALVFNELKQADPARNVIFTAPDSVMVDGDARLLRITLENLIGNAFKFTSKTPAARIEFGVTQREGQTAYFIRDNGAGFDMQYVDRLFTAFQRLHGDRDFKGSGIGLATVSRIIRRHHGNIWAESEVGHGATFYFTLAA